MNWQQWEKLNEAEDEISDSTQWAVMVALVSFASPGAAECYAGKRKIAARARFKVDAKGNNRAVDRAINALVEAGHISVISRGGGASNENCYKVHIGGENWAETPSLKRGYDMEKTPPLGTQTPSFSTSKESKTPSLDTSQNEKPRLSVHPYKVEGIYKRYEEECMDVHASSGECVTQRLIIDNEADSKTLAGICKINISNPSEKDLEIWPLALSEVRDSLPNEPPEERATRLRLFRDWWHATPAQNGQPKTRVYLSHVQHHFRGFVASRPSGTMSELQKRLAERDASRRTVRI